MGKRLQRLLSFSSAIDIGSFRGIRFRLHYSWFVIFAIVTYAFSAQLYPEVFPGLSVLTGWILGIITSLLFFASVLTHEMAHSMVARRNGIGVKGITLFIFGGVAQITSEATEAKAELKMAAAGPACSVLLAGLFALLYFLTHFFSEHVSVMFEALAGINLAVAVFNLIPGFPLDGGRILHSVIWLTTGNFERSLRIATRGGQIVAGLFILGGLAIIVFFENNWFNGVWLAFIGYFLGFVASASYRSIIWQRRASRLMAYDAMTQNYMIVPEETTIRNLVQNQSLFNERLVFWVTVNGMLKGLAPLKQVLDVPPAQWDDTVMRDVMTLTVQPARPADSLLTVLENMNAAGVDYLPVISNGQPAGIISRDNLMKAIRNEKK